MPLQSSRDLTAEDKRNLDSQITNFLESDAEIHCDNNSKKIQYCFEAFKRFFELSRDPNSCLKKVEYYKTMVVERDKEICILFVIIFAISSHCSWTLPELKVALLIDMMKKEGGKNEKTKEDRHNPSSNHPLPFLSLLFILLLDNRFHY